MTDSNAAAAIKDVSAAYYDMRGAFIALAMALRDDGVFGNAKQLCGQSDALFEDAMDRIINELEGSVE